MMWLWQVKIPAKDYTDVALESLDTDDHDWWLMTTMMPLIAGENENKNSESENKNVRVELKVKTEKESNA